MKHIVVIMAEQLRADFLGKGMTPHIDALREESICFENAFCASPLCVPARGAFFTGRYPNETGSLINPWRKADERYGYVKQGIPNLFTLLDEEFDSAHSGKQHFLTEENLCQRADSKTHWVNSEADYAKMLKEKEIPAPGGPAFRCLVPELQQNKYTHVQHYSSPHTGCYPYGLENFFDGYFLDGALQAIKIRNTEKPLLLNVMFLAPHPPLDIPEPWYSKYTSVPMSGNVCQWYSHQSPLQIYNLSGAIGTKFTEEVYKEAWRVYAGLVTLLDDCVGQLVDALRQEGIYDDTLILFTSDHGEMLGSHTLFQKMCMYEEAVHVPMIWKFPKNDSIACKTITETVSHIDVLPTLLSWLGKEIPSGISGMNLMPMILGQCAHTGREQVFIQFDGNGALGNYQRCCVDNQYKLIIDMFKDEIFVELYDRAADPLESQNLAFDSTYWPTAAAYIEKIRTFMANTGDRLQLPDPQTILNGLQQYDM